MLDRKVLPRSVLVECPHGDPTCPCPDGDCCHYEGTDDDRTACPLLVLLEDGDGRQWSQWPDRRMIRVGDMHCHVEGCRWDETEGCGLAKLGALVQLDPPIGSVHWRCGVYRSAACNGGRVWTS